MLPTATRRVTRTAGYYDGNGNPKAVYNETVGNFQVIMLLMFMVAGIYFMRDMLLYTFTKILLGVRSKTLLSFLFCFAGAVLSAFLDALTVTAVLITVSVGFYSVYHKVASGKRGANSAHNHTNDDNIKANQVENLEQFRAFLRSLIMHGAVGTALGGVTTLVGEPQNLLIAEKAGWGVYGVLPAYGAGHPTGFCLRPYLLCIA